MATESAVDSCKPTKAAIRHLLGLPKDITGGDVVSACHAGAQVWGREGEGGFFFFFFVNFFFVVFCFCFFIGSFQ